MNEPKPKEPKGERSNYCEYCGDFHEPYHDYETAKVGELVPDYEFEAIAEGERRTLKFSDYRGTWLVLMFYPADFSSLCPTELADMASRYNELRELGAEVLAISTDSLYTHEAWRNSSEEIRTLPYSLAADPSGKVALAFGVLIEGGELGYLKNEGMALRGTFVIDPKGILRTMEVHDVAVARSAKETLRKLKAVQFVDLNPGKTCPPDWE